MEKRLLTLIIAALFSAGASAAGTGHAGKSEQMGQSEAGAQTGEVMQETASFDQFDSDGDGYISKQEADQLDELAGNIDQYDQNQDEQLDRSEFAQFETEVLQQQQEQPGQEEILQQSPSTDVPSGESGM